MILVAAFNHVNDFIEFEQAQYEIDFNEFAQLGVPATVDVANDLLNASRMTADPNLRYMTLEERVEEDLFDAWTASGDSVALGLISVDR